MRKLPVAVGLLLIFVGLILASSSNSSVTDESWETVAENTGQWSVSSDFNVGDNMTLTIAWSGSTYGEDLGELPANVTITANNQDRTEFQIFFLQSAENPPGQERVKLYVSRAQLLYNNGNSLRVDDPPRQIGGIVNQAGTFEALVHRPPDSFPWAGYPEPEPPTALKLLRVVVRKTYLYGSLLPLGGVVGFLGVVISLWGAKTDKNAARIRKRKKNK